MRHTDPNEARAAAEAALGLRQLNERSREIFKRIVETYLATGEPVGSRNLSRALPMTLSPASVRNVMSDLESLGLIYAPHTSAGTAADADRLAPVHRRLAGDRRHQRRGAQPDREPHRRQRPAPRHRGAARRGRRDAVGTVALRRRGAGGEAEQAAEARRVRQSRTGARAGRAGRRGRRRREPHHHAARRAAARPRCTRPRTISMPASAGSPSPRRARASRRRSRSGARNSTS